MLKPRITAALIALTMNAIALGSTTIAHADAPVATRTTETITVNGQGSSLTITLDSPVSDQTATQIQAQLNPQPSTDESSVEPLKIDPGPIYPVVKSSESNRKFTDRNGTFNVRYNGSYNNVNWGYKVAAPLAAITAGPMVERGIDWYKVYTHIGHGGRHVVPVTYLLHGTQGGLKSGDQLSWNDVLTFPVEAGGVPGKAVLTIGGTFVVVK
jgi:hypothetical protein